MLGNCAGARHEPALRFPKQSIASRTIHRRSCNWTNCAGVPQRQRDWLLPLAFGPDLSGPRRVIQWTEDRFDGEVLDLAGMLTAVRELDNAEELPPEHRGFLLRGSSLGGAQKPQRNIKAGNGSRSSDVQAIAIQYAGAEYIAMTLATEVGLDVPPVHLAKVLNQDIYLIERFDRIPAEQGYRRVPFISGLTIIGAHESESPQQSYRRLAEQLRVLGSNPVKDAKELWRRMVFNILCNNTDDHLRNHGFLWDGKGWRLSPLYDVMPFSEAGLERYLAIGVGKDGRRATVNNALSDVASFGLDTPEAVAIAVSMQKTVKARWEALFRQHKFTAVEIERFRPPLSPATR